jgi:2-iminobutanoate/2-iminopropanoate deaminase
MVKLEKHRPAFHPFSPICPRSPRQGEKMKKEILSTDKGFVSRSPLSQAVKAGNLIFISGQIPVDSATLRVVSEDFRIQARTVLENIKGIVEAAGVSLTEVIKTTVFLTDMARFQEMNEIYREYFPTDPPARTCLGVKELPRQAQIEIEAVAFLGNLRPPKVKRKSV